MYYIALYYFIINYTYYIHNKNGTLKCSIKQVILRNYDYKKILLYITYVLY